MARLIFLINDFYGRLNSDLIHLSQRRIQFDLLLMNRAQPWHKVLRMMQNAHCTCVHSVSHRGRCPERLVTLVNTPTDAPNRSGRLRRVAVGGGLWPIHPWPEAGPVERASRTVIEPASDLPVPTCSALRWTSQLSAFTASLHRQDQL